MSMGKAEFAYLYFEEKIKKTMDLFGYYYIFNIYSGQILFFDLNCRMMIDDFDMICTVFKFTVKSPGNYFFHIELDS